MTTITLSLEKLQQDRTAHEEAIKRIDAIIQYYFTDNKADNKSPDDKKTLNTNSELAKYGKTRMEQAVAICEEYLRNGNTVRTTKEWLKLIESKGVLLSRGGLGLAIKKYNSKIYFDTTTRSWKLKS